MEKQKVFWVVLSVSVFVVVVLLVGVLLLRQHPSSSPRTAVSPASDTGSQIYEYQREAPQTSAGSAPLAGNPPSGDQQTMHFYIGEGGGQPPQSSNSSAPVGGVTNSAMPPASGSAKASATAVPLSGAPEARSQSTHVFKPQSSRPSVHARTQRKAADYWIQTGSYKSQTKAEDLVALLQGKGLGSRVFSYSTNGDTFYRVRVGPYSNKGEADKFLALVKQVQGLESSYISMIPVAKSAVN
jgi:cell division protein FtsN